MCVNDRHDMTLAVKVALNLDTCTTSQSKMDSQTDIVQLVVLYNAWWQCIKTPFSGARILIYSEFVQDFLANLILPFPKRQILEYADENFKFYENGRKFFKTVEKRCGNRRNCSLRAISPFLTVFSKNLYCRQVKTRACLGKGCTWKGLSFFYVFLRFPHVACVTANHLVRKFLYFQKPRQVSSVVSVSDS